MPAVRAGKLRHKGWLQKPENSQDPETGEIVTVWNTIAEPWMDIVPMSAREFIAAGAEQSEARGRITIRYRGEVTSAMRIVLPHRNLVYNILGVLPDAESGIEHQTLMTGEGVRYRA